MTTTKAGPRKRILKPGPDNPRREAKRVVVAWAEAIKAADALLAAMNELKLAVHAADVATLDGLLSTEGRKEAEREVPGLAYLARKLTEGLYMHTFAPNISIILAEGKWEGFPGLDAAANRAIFDSTVRPRFAELGIDVPAGLLDDDTAVEAIDLAAP